MNQTTSLGIVSPPLLSPRISTFFSDVTDEKRRGVVPALPKGCLAVKVFLIRIIPQV